MKRFSITMLMALLAVLGLAWFVSLALGSGAPSVNSLEFHALLADAPARVAAAWKGVELPHPGLIAAGAGGVMVLIGAYYGCRTVSQRANEKNRRTEEALRIEQIADKARRTVAVQSPRPADGPSRLESQLTQSAVFSLLDVVDTCVANGQYDQALQWIRHAIRTSPGAHQFEVKLAEVYYKKRDLAGFLPLTQELHEKLHEKHPELWERVVRMGSELIPMHPLFRAANSAKAGK